jgi:hypothetical protein
MGDFQTVLPFLVEPTDESLTAHGGLALFGEYVEAMRTRQTLDAELPAPGSHNGYAPSEHAIPIVLTLAGGGCTLEDIRVVRDDGALRALLDLHDMPSSDATGDWLRRMGASDGLDGVLNANVEMFRRILSRDARSSFTLDMDATQIVAEKREARYTYKSEKGYMPMVGHIAENGMVVAHEFREGNIAPADRNYEFVLACEAAMPAGKRIGAVRADSASYQASIFNHCEANGQVFAIAARQDEAVQAAIAAIPESDWTRFDDGWIAETVHCMGKTNEAFRLVVVRRPRDIDMFEKESPWRYHAVASNRAGEDAAATMRWYSKRGDASENRIKELKIGVGMESMPCGTFEANAVFFALGVLTYNLYIGFRMDTLGGDMATAQLRTVRWRLFQTAGRVVRHARKLALKIPPAMVATFREIRLRCARVAAQVAAASAIAT